MDTQAIAMDSGFASLAASYRGVLEELLDDVAAHWGRVLTGQDTTTVQPDIEALIHLAHRLAGSAASFGYMAVSQAAFDLERALRDSQAGCMSGLIGHLLPKLTALVAAPRVADLSVFGATSQASSPVPVVAPSVGQKPVFIVDPDAKQAEELAKEIAPFGYAIRLFSNIQDAIAAISVEPPCAIVTELEFPTDDIAGARLTSRLAGTIPVIVTSKRSDFAARLAVARGGCAAHLTKPVEMLDLVNWLDELTGMRPGEPYRIVVLDDDRHLAEFHGGVLTAAGMQVRVLSEPVDLLPTLEEFAPDLILMDMYMPGCNGIELARVVRQHRKYLGTPIVFLSVESDLTRQVAALSPGADDFLTKPIKPEHLVQVVRIRTLRARGLRTVMETDSLTGLLNHAHIKERLAFEQSRAIRLNAPLTFALIDLDHFKKVNDGQGHLAGDQVIRSLARLLSNRLRRTDIIGRYGGEEFAVILPDTMASDAKRVIDDIRDSFGQIAHNGNAGEFRVSLSGGLAEFHGGNQGEVQILEADGALYQAKAGGRDRLMIADVPSLARSCHPVSQ